MTRQSPTTTTTPTVAIIGSITVVDNALSQLLESEGYSTRVLKASPAGELLEEMPQEVDVVLLAPSLTKGECEAFLSALRAASSKAKAARIPVIMLCTPMQEAPVGDEEAVRMVPWPTKLERLFAEIESALESRLPAGYHLDRTTDPNAIVLRRPGGSVVARFSTLGATREAIEKEAQEDRSKKEQRKKGKRRTQSA